EAPRLIFPFARQVLASTIQAGRFPPLLLEPVDFLALYRRNLAAAAEKAKQNGGPADAAQPTVDENELLSNISSKPRQTGAFSCSFHVADFDFDSLVFEPERAIAHFGDEGSMGRSFLERQPAGQGGGSLTRRSPGAAAAYGDLGFGRKSQRHLPAPDQLEIDLGQDLAVEQRPVQRAAGIV